MVEAIRIVEQLLRDSEQWRRDHLRAGRRFEAAAASIRIKALRDARDELVANLPPEPPPAASVPVRAVA